MPQAFPADKHMKETMHIRRRPKLAHPHNNQIQRKVNDICGLQGKKSCVSKMAR
jgi:hypothetical protein